MTRNLSLLELKKVNRVYGKGDKTFPALKDINLKINEGEFVALVGPSGCGKSTLLRIITGLQQASSGEVRYKGDQI